VVVEQEHLTGRTFPAIAITMGKYGSKAITMNVQDWSGKVNVFLFTHTDRVSSKGLLNNATLFLLSPRAGMSFIWVPFPARTEGDGCKKECL